MATVFMYDHILYAKGHLIARWADRMEREITRATAFAAPFNKRPNKGAGAEGPPGYLKSSIAGTTIRTGLRSISATTWSTASYAKYVALGTSAQVRGGGRPFFVPLNPGAGRDITPFIFAVSGQAPQNFFEAGLDIASRKYPSLRG